MKLQAVIFDMDGVLADTIEHHYRSWKEVARSIGISFTRRDNEKLRGLSRRSCLDLLLEGRELSEDEYFRLLEMKNDLFLEYIKDMGPGDLMPGVMDLINELRRNGIAMGIASSSSNVHLVLEKLDLGKYIAAVGDRYKVPRLKPDPDIFLFTASALGVPPEACIVIEDSLAGIQAAQAAGMCVVLVGTTPRLDEKPDARFSSLAQVSLQRLQQVHENWFSRQPGNAHQVERGRRLENNVNLK
jgi:beta-phosphoglucomutase